MPCDSSYLAPSERERAQRHAAELLAWLQRKLGEDSTLADSEAANTYGGDGKSFGLLCERLAAMPKQERDSLIYNAHDKHSRALADWWEAHEEYDAARRAAEAESRESAALRKAALVKLTGEEKEALGLSSRFPEE